MDNAHVCHKCPKMDPDGWVCGADPERHTIAAHAMAGECPQNRFSGGLVAATVHGVAGAVKSLLRVGRAADAVIAERRAVCGGCPELVSVAGIKQCRICRCVYELKITNADESCPLGKWPAISG